MEIIEIKAIALEIVSSISKIFKDAEVVIVDLKGNYLAADSEYRKRKGTDEWLPYINAIIARNEVVIIENPGDHEMCKNCKNEGHCPQTLEISVPFNLDDEFVGYISMVTFTEEKKLEYLAQKNDIVDFLQSNIKLMIGAAREQMALKKSTLLLKELNATMNSINTAIVDCDINGEIKYANEAFMKWIGQDLTLTKNKIEEVLSSPIIEEIFTCKEDKSECEAAVTIQDQLHRMIVSSRIVYDQLKNPHSIVMSFQNVNELRNVVLDHYEHSNEEALDMIIGKSDAIQYLKAQVIDVSKSVSTVLIIGETGTGKELFARAIHGVSSRSDKPFVTINCAAIPENLLESELFGYEDGAFTGGRKGGKAGLFEIANGGTLFLDEIGDMPIHLQSKLLRVLQEKEIVRIGGYKPLSLDLRIISATHQDLEELMLEKRFRKDLFYRLNVIQMMIPPLRKRLSDYEVLLEYFIHKYNLKLGKHIRGYDHKFYEAIMQYQWPGNIRELENAIEYSINVEKQDCLSYESVMPRIVQHKEQENKSSGLKNQLALYEKEVVRRCVKKYENVPHGLIRAAEELGISRASLYRKIKELE